MTEPTGSTPIAPPIAPSHRRPPRARWKTVLLSAVVFLCGGLLGSGLTLIYIGARVRHIIEHPEKAPAMLTARLKSRLSLSDDQARKVAEILRQRQIALQAIRREVHPRVALEIEKAREEITAVLTPEQAKKWDEQFELMKKRWAPPPPPASSGK
jgi:hypothetical protein